VSGAGPARTSMETLRSIAEGTGHTSAVATTFGQRLGDLEVGRVRSHMPGHPTCAAGLGSALVLADLSLGAAISSARPGSGVQTLRTQVATAGSRTAATGALTADCRLTTTAEGSATSAGEVRAEDGRVVITMSSRCRVGPAPSASPSAPVAADAHPLHDPWSDLALCADHTGSDRVLHAVAALSNLSGVVQGGVIAAVLTHAAEDELGAVPADWLDVDVAYLRGVPADGSRLPVVVEVVHPGRHYGLARATLLDRDGRPAVTATVGTWVAGPATGPAPGTRGARTAG
jgi:acyl-coenzyme A thioesterase PaaI-like protein